MRRILRALGGLRRQAVSSNIAPNRSACLLGRLHCDVLILLILTWIYQRIHAVNNINFKNLRDTLDLEPQ